MMTKTKRTCLYFIAGFFSLYLVSGQAGEGRKGSSATGENKDGTFVLWAHSDIQPRKRSERAYYEDTIQDVSRNIPGIDMAIVAGDIAHYAGMPDVYEWFLKTRSEAKIPFWYEIAGNHDAKDYKSYADMIGKPLHYAVRIGNILILFMSDEMKSTPTDISDATFAWWRDQVIRNQDRIIITVTHAYLMQGGLTGSSIPSRIIIESERFSRIMERYRVDIWICGHTHLPDGMLGKENVSKKHNGTLFLNVSAMRRDPLVGIESRVLLFRNDSREVKIKLRRHEERRFDKDREIDFRLSRPFRWNHNPPEMEPPQP